ncbi:orotate phosphoribosyltransferase [Fructilactobacillus myrtifloralis]|uniref:Orotate phosphoribosyltransferase n=1 Tax=Fructilactobacillus myrtifloralis TaxID=2940301 RepID=A0ABY5BTX6_9LACO|nr:orotate phosphoribosyltransferase [Fructilactobacillus myrtifloralis]USS85809.1 orotate phosphoribosyltransferase [Fructilactobacillus myrtifloralis]
MEKLETQILTQMVADGIVQLNAKQPFQFASGIQSPIYTDLRLTISYPELRTNLATALAKLIQTQYPNVTVIGGVATAGIPHAALVANALNLPMVYVRSKPKDHGTGKQIEGRLTKQDQVVLIDDLISTGGSVLQAAQAVQRAGDHVAGVVSIFSYGFPDAEENFKAAGVPFTPLLTYAQLIQQLRAQQVITPEQYQRFNQWHHDPWNWIQG